LQPKTFPLHSTLLFANAVNDEILRHPVKICSAIRYGRSGRIVQPDPEFLENVLSFDGITDSRGEEAEQFAAIQAVYRFKPA
jgi:hypothetical protein